MTSLMIFQLCFSVMSLLRLTAGKTLDYYPYFPEFFCPGATCLPPGGIRLKVKNDLKYILFFRKDAQQEASFVEMSGSVDYQPIILSTKALQTLDMALTTRNPKANYSLEEKQWTKPLELLKII